MGKEITLPGVQANSQSMAKCGINHGDEAFDISQMTVVKVGKTG